MNRARVCFVAVFLISCGAREHAGDVPASAAKKPAAQGEVTDEKIGLPAYPKAEEVEYSRVHLHTEVGDTYSVSYKTADSPTQVAAFYQTETAKLGTLKESISTSELLKSVAVDRTDGSQSAIQARTDNKGATIITVHRFFPAK